MPLSRLRLRLAGWFSLAFLAGLLLLSLFLYFYMRRRNDARLSAALHAEALEFAEAVRREYAENPADGLASATAAALEEWPASPDGFAVYDATGKRVATGGLAGFAAVLPLHVDGAWSMRDVAGPGEHGIRLASVPGAHPVMRVVAAGSLERLDEDTESLVRWLAVSVPLTVFLSLLAGYTLSRRALKPVGDLERSIGALGPDELDRRLLTGVAPDEIGRVAVQFNGLLERLEASRARNRRFLEEAAHQIRTPLTLVLGETELALSGDGDATAAGASDALRRVRLAATQMRRRVEELLLLARADAGERAPLADLVELDGLALEAVDLMRARATGLGRRLELGAMDPVTVTGSASLLREAVVELLENACRHGGTSDPVRLSVTTADGSAILMVSNSLTGAAADPPAGHGLGLQVVEWIASEHGGVLRREAGPAHVEFCLIVPAGSVS